MQVIVRGVHLTVTPALREYVDRHVVLHLEKFHTRDPVEVEVHLSRASKGDEAAGTNAEEVGDRHRPTAADGYFRRAGTIGLAKDDCFDWHIFNPCVRSRNG